MTIAVMQPYFLPYLGYWQLMAGVDRFILLDDVSFIKRGWINRNRLFVGGREYLMTVPLEKPSQNRTITDHRLVEDETWKGDLKKTVDSAYARAPHFPTGREVLEEILATSDRSLAGFLAHSLGVVMSKLGIGARLDSSSLLDPAREQRGQDRILELCRRAGADRYVNLPGGRELYERSLFAARGIELKFLRTDWERAGLDSPSGDPTFSILDLLMQNSLERIGDALWACDFVD